MMTETSMSVRLVFAGLRGANVGVARCRVKCRHPRDVTTLPAVKKSEPEKITAHKTPRGTERKVRPAGFLIIPQRMAQKILAVAGYFRDLFVNAFGVVMQKMVAQFTGFAAHEQFIVGVNAAPFRRITPPQSGLPVGIPVAMANPASTISRESGEIKS